MFSVCMVTARANPGYQYMIDSLVLAVKALHVRCGAVPIEFVTIDEEMWHRPKERQQELEVIVAGRIPFQIHAPKPTTWRGPHRLTSKDYWGKNSALNTAVCYAKNTHLCLLDDCVLVPENWLIGHYLTAQQGVAAAGGYIYYHLGAKTENGKLLEGRPHTPSDYRREKYKDGLQACGAGEMFGGNVSYPLNILLKIGGWDEILDGSKGLDDCLMGVRAGMLVKTMFIPEIETHYLTDTHEIIDRAQGRPVAEIRGEIHIENPASKTKLFPYKDANGLIHMMTYNHLAIWRLTAHKLGKHPDGVNYTAVYDPALEPCKTDYRPIGNYFNLKTLRNWVQAGKPFPKPEGPTVDWRGVKKQRLEDM